MGVFWAERKSNQADCASGPAHITQWHLSSLTERDVILGCWTLWPGISQSSVPPTTLFDFIWKKKKLILNWGGGGTLQRPTVCVCVCVCVRAQISVLGSDVMGHKKYYPINNGGIRGWNVSLMMKLRLTFPAVILQQWKPYVYLCINMGTVWGGANLQKNLYKMLL